MVKYIKVGWPELQRFQQLDEYDQCYEYIGSSESNDWYIFVPEDLYNEVMYKLQFPKKYENTNLGTIVCYETRAIVNGNETFWYDLSDLKRGNKVLVYNHDIPSGYNEPEWIITTCKACSEGLPIILEDNVVIPGINCEIIGHYNPEIPF